MTGILSYEADPNIVDEVTGMSPLLYAVASGCVPVSIALLRNGARKFFSSVVRCMVTYSH